MLPALLVAGLAAGLAGADAAPPDSTLIHHGRKNRLSVITPRIEAAIEVDGQLDEPVWQSAAILTGFSQYAPADGIAAADSTEVLVWYSPTAIHFGIRAFEAHGAVRATLAERDRIATDDYVQLLLGTFDDGRQATLIGVNPLGVQADGVLVETGRLGSGSFNGATVVREPADLSPDFVFDSKGRLTDQGYEIEIRVPFKSLRYQPEAEQSWTLQVVRGVQHSGAQETWAPALRASASFLGQSGRLTALSGMRRGLVLDANPVLTARTDGAPRASGGWGYGETRPEVGLNLRWGVTNNLTMNGTVNPDFSQVEADAGQLTFDPRQSVFVSEKRPFFLDGIEQFATPNQLVYTRRIAQPEAAVKLTGKAFGADIGVLSAVDDRIAGLSGEQPIYNILRVQRDLGRQSRIGAVYTDRIDGDGYNRVAGVDGRYVFGRIYSAQVQLAASRTRQGGESVSAPLWHARFNRNGRTFGMTYSANAIHEDFRAGSGFISRPGVVNINVAHRLTGYGSQQSLVQSLTGEVGIYQTWKYATFADGGSSQDRKLHLNFNSALRGGWRAGASVLIETFGYDPDIYEHYRIEAPDGAGGLDTLPFVGTPRLSNLDWVLSGATPEFAKFSGDIFLLWGRDENFYEWASGDILWITLNTNFRPTDKLRLTASYLHQQVDRPSDGSAVSVWRIPRLKMEYQVSRPFFVRLIGEYNAYSQLALRDDSRTNNPILIFDAGAGDFVRTTPIRDNSFRGDLLLAYQPNPGTVIFAGYGSTLREPLDGLPDRRLRRTEDAVFVKMSYLWRM
jgi:hypothetical protein